MDIPVEAWYAGIFSRHSRRTYSPVLLETEKMTRPADYERVLAVLPVGTAPENKDFQERFISGLIKSHQRKPLAELVDGEVQAPWMEKALEAARLAPSARNRQPWRFRIEERAITISVNEKKSATSISRRLDCGIAMLHFEVGAMAAGVKGGWEFLSSPDVARFGY